MTGEELTSLAVGITNNLIGEKEFSAIVRLSQSYADGKVLEAVRRIQEAAMGKTEGSKGRNCDDSMLHEMELIENELTKESK